jgi:hypothetical protein
MCQSLLRGLLQESADIMRKRFYIVHYSILLIVFGL